MGRILGRDPVPEAHAGEDTAEVLVIGDEILRGIVRDSNGHYIASSLTGSGISVGRICSLPDALDMISREVAAARVRGASLVVTSGGLGPTTDDLTLSAVAMACGVPLALDEDALELVTMRYAALAGEGSIPAGVTPERRKMAMLPSGAVPVPNSVGTAPGAILDLTDTLIVCLPGVPAELEAMWTGPVAEVLTIRFGPRGHVASTVVAGCDDESVLAPHAGAVAGRHPGAYVKTRVRVTLDAIGPDTESASRALDEALEDLRVTLARAGIDLRQEATQAHGPALTDDND